MLESSINNIKQCLARAIAAMQQIKYSAILFCFLVVPIHCIISIDYYVMTIQKWVWLHLSHFYHNMKTTCSVVSNLVYCAHCLVINDLILTLLIATCFAPIACYTYSSCIAV